MTSTTATPTVRSAESHPFVLGAGSGVLAAALTAAFAHDWAEIAFSVGIIAGVTALVVGVVMPRALRKESAGGTALGLSIPAILLALPAFWSGLPLVLGVAGLVVGNHGRLASSGARKSIVAVVLGSIAVLVYLAIYVMSGIAGDTGFLLD
jgi:hypothetical protein